MWQRKKTGARATFACVQKKIVQKISFSMICVQSERERGTEKRDKSRAKEQKNKTKKKRVERTRERNRNGMMDETEIDRSIYVDI